MSFSWTGRQLDSVTKDGVTTTYTYDSNGLRTSKTTGDDVTEYTYLGSSLVYQVTNKGQSDEVSLYFYYDDTGLAAFYYESAQYPSDNGIYHYVKDIQGNIWGLIDSNGELIARDHYSAYGEYWSKWYVEEGPTSVLQRNNRVRNANPFHYRGYYYDEETDLYYCQSRYYDPDVGRFINTDSAIGVNNDMAGYNLFVYCGNNPVSRYDDGGMFWKELWQGVKNVVRDALHFGNNVLTSVGIDTAAVGAFFLMMEKDDKGIYHASFDCWQQYAGYNELYDFAFDIGTSMLSDNFSFTYDGSGYTIWVWKGDYINLGAGAELGIYHGASGHRFVDKSLAMSMGMYIKYGRETIISYYPREYQWWLTGFNPSVQNVNASDLTVHFFVKFNNAGMYGAFKSQVGDPRWSFPRSPNVAVLVF